MKNPYIKDQHIFDTCVDLVRLSVLLKIDDIKEIYRKYSQTGRLNRRAWFKFVNSPEMNDWLLLQVRLLSEQTREMLLATQSTEAGNTLGEMYLRGDASQYPVAMFYLKYEEIPAGVLHSDWYGAQGTVFARVATYFIFKILFPKTVFEFYTSGCWYRINDKLEYEVTMVQGTPPESEETSKK